MTKNTCNFLKFLIEILVTLILIVKIVNNNEIFVSNAFIFFVV